MAANNIIIGSKFKPFSYEELLKPVMMAQEAHTAMEDEYSALSSQAEIWKNMANKETSPVAYNLYQTFATNLDQAASTLATEGLSPTNRQSLLNVRKLYKSNISGRQHRQPAGGVWKTRTTGNSRGKGSA